MRRLYPFWYRALLVAAVLLAFVSAAQAQVKTRFGVRVPMRDGVELTADIWMPRAPGRYPAILVRTPYNRIGRGSAERGIYFASRGYVVVSQDTRGRGDSGGEFGKTNGEYNFLVDDGKDGYDTIEWIAAQPWSNGSVGMMGGSYLASVQWLAAREKPPHLVCIVPTAPAGRYFDELPYQGGAFLMAWALSWANRGTDRLMQDGNRWGLDWERIFNHRPLLTMDEELGRPLRLWRAWLKHDRLDAYWKRLYFSPADFRKIEIPTLTITGWFDSDQSGALWYWDGMAAHSPAKDKQFLIIGPWTHGGTRRPALKVGEMEFSEDSVLDMRGIHLAFFEHFLKGASPQFEYPRALVYVTGTNRWLKEPTYPPARVQHRPLYLHSGGKANTLSGDGQLSWDAPGAEPPDQFTYDPRNPVPSDTANEISAKANYPLAAEHFNAADNRAIEQREDVLVYSSEVLDKPLTILGRVFVHLYASSDAPDTDFTAKILDVYPDGRAVKLGHGWPAGIIRARYRNGYERPELLTPNKPEKFRIELFDIGHTFLPGHRVRLEISSSSFPFVNPNSNTGNPIATDTDWRIARQTIHHEGKMPSHVLLPVLPE
ncbi:MAG: CocE/NonD family hydrolase [Acidobacteria bacterium]|nr:CocE/NonD family hydrolase [Acidobacteriota bacterium]